MRFLMEKIKLTKGGYEKGTGIYYGWDREHVYRYSSADGTVTGSIRASNRALAKERVAVQVAPIIPQFYQ